MAKDLSIRIPIISDFKKFEEDYKDMINRLNKNGELKPNSTLPKIKKEIDQTKKSTDLLGQSIFDAGKKFASWLIIGNTIMGAVRQIEFGIDSVIELDREMTNLKKVTDETDITYRKFLITANETAKILGRTTQEVVKSSSEFARLGFNIKQSAMLAQEALLFSSVGDFSIEDSTRSLISIVKGFGIVVDEEGKNIRKIVDMGNEVANNFAIDQAGIAEALRRSASSLSTAGNSLEESIALIAASNSVIQDASVVGTGLKTVSMRLRGITDEGEEVQDLVPKLENEFKNLGLSLKKDEDTFYNTYEIMKQLASVWSDLTDLQKSNILELVAGKRQGNIVSALLSNWTDAQQSLETALNSSGSAIKEFTKYMDSIEYKSGVLQAELTEMWQSFIASDAIKSFIDSLTSVVRTIDVMINEIGILQTVLVALIPIVGFKLANAFFVTDKAIKTASITTASFSLATGGVLALLSLIPMAFAAYAYSVQKANQELKDFIGNTKNKLGTIEEEIKQLEKMKSEYEILASKTSLTVEEKDKLRQLEQKLIEINPSIIGNINNQGVAFDNLRGAIDETLKKKREYYKESTELAQKEAKLNIGIIKDKINKGEQDLLKNNQMLKDAEINYEIAKTTDNGYGFDIKLAQIRYQDVLKDQRKILEDLEINKTLFNQYKDFLYPFDANDPGNLPTGFIANPKKDNNNNNNNNNGNTSTKTPPTPYTSKLDQFLNQLQLIEEKESEITMLQKQRDLTTEQERIPLIEKEIELQNSLIELNDKLLKDQISARNEVVTSLAKQFSSVVKVAEDMETLSVNTDGYNKLTDAQKEKLDELINSFTNYNKSIISSNNSILDGQKAVKSLQQEIQNYVETITKQYQDYIFYSLDTEIEKLEELKKIAQETTQIKIDTIQKEIDQLEDRNNLLKEQEDRERRLADIAKQREKIANIQANKNVRIFKDGQFVWTADPRVLREETERLQEIQEEFNSWEVENKRQSEIEKLNNQIEAIQKASKTQEKGFDTDISNLREFIRDQKNLIEKQDNWQITDLETLTAKLEKIDKDSYNTRLKDLLSFVSEYSKKMSEISSIPSTATGSITIGSQTYNLGQGVGTEEQRKTNEDRLKTDKSFVQSETERAKQVIDDRKKLGLDTKLQEDYLSSLKHYSEGGVIDHTGLAVVHGSKSSSEIAFNATQAKNLYDFVKFTIPKINIPNLNNSLQPAIAGATNYNFNIDKVQTNDIGYFMNLAKRKVRS